MIVTRPEPKRSSLRSLVGAMFSEYQSPSIPYNVITVPNTAKAPIMQQDATATARLTRAFGAAGGLAYSRMGSSLDTFSLANL
jgi:hypothetical protein